jgi:serine/threonine protein kinase
MWNPLNTLFRRSGGRTAAPQAHMTFGRTTIGRTVTRAGLLLKKQLWIWPIVAVVLLAIIGRVVGTSIHDTMEGSLRSELETLLTVERAMLEKWLHVQEAGVKSLADQRTVRRLVAELVGGAGLPSADAPAGATQAANKSVVPAEQIARLSAELEPGMASHHFVGYVLVDKQMRVAASNEEALIGETAVQYESFLHKAFEGRTTVSVPYPSTVLLKDARGRLRSGIPTMVACAPVRDDNLQVVGVLAMRIRPEREFTEILQLGRFGDSGETYAINRDGLMVSNCRFDEQLILLGILPDTDDAASILTVDVRDPGGDITSGFRPTVRRRELPLTGAADAATRGSSGVNTEGYRGYRGLLKAGAYTWLPEYDLGIITECDHAEAFRPLLILKRTFYVLFGLLGLTAAAIFIFTLIVSRLRRKAREAEIEARQLGQYRLEEQIGAGAMGVVYRGQHAMLRRPTAIKLLEVDRAGAEAVSRFEREVQITCNLNNPHTVAVFDYGRTPEGVFYYAMEFLDGINLQALVDRDGPQPEGRVVSILRQICASLYEAHGLGLVHRDVKPANVMLNRRGGESDVVKVLDFGLAKSAGDREAGGMSGTPLYMSPEAVLAPDTVDARSDLYAVGAIGYFLLTGTPAFNAKTLAELCRQHIEAIPEAPSRRLGRAVSPELEHALLACLEKNRAQRPQTARDLATMLDQVAARWSSDDADRWWGRFDRDRQRGQPAATGAATATMNPEAAATFELGPADRSSESGGKQDATPNRQNATDAHLDRTQAFGPSEGTNGAN